MGLKIISILLLICISNFGFAQNSFQAKIDTYTSFLDSEKAPSFKIEFPAAKDSTLKFNCVFFVDTNLLLIKQIVEYDLVDNDRIIHYYFKQNKLIKVKVELVTGYANPICLYYYNNNRFISKRGYSFDETEFDDQYYKDRAEFYLYNRDYLIKIAKKKLKIINATSDIRTQRTEFER